MNVSQNARSVGVELQLIALLAVLLSRLQRSSASSFRLAKCVKSKLKRLGQLVLDVALRSTWQLTEMLSKLASFKATSASLPVGSKKEHARLHAQRVLAFMLRGSSCFVRCAMVPSRRHAAAFRNSRASTARADSPQLSPIVASVSSVKGKR